MSRPEITIRIKWRGPISTFLRDQTPEIDLEGALSSGKTTACLWKVRNSTIEFPGIHWFMCRFGDGDTTTKLCPAFEQVCRTAGEVPTWMADELCYVFANGSRVYAFGLKSPDHLSRYSKLRGLGVAGIYNDQTEELPEDFSGELRARLRQPGYPHQLIFSPNPPNVTHWLAKQFPEVSQNPDRKYYAISLYDNAHNLPPETIRALEAAYPPDHAKYRSVIMGKRGLNVIGTPVYEKLFGRRTHVRPIPYQPDGLLYEAWDFGKHHPCVIWGQRPYDGGLHLLAGILGQDIFLDDFIPLILQKRAEWFPVIGGLQACCDPAGSHDNSQGSRYNGVSILQDHGVHVVWKSNSNAPDVRLAMIERLGGHMRKRGLSGEAYGIEADPSRWLRASHAGFEQMGFLADGCEAGYVWDEHMVSVGNKQVRKAKKDGWFEHGQNCQEYMELNFGAAQETQQQTDVKAQKARDEQAEALRWRPRGQSQGNGWMSR